MKNTILTASLACFVTSLSAQSIWTGGGADDSMFNPLNWSPVGAPPINADIVFDGSAGLFPFVDAGTFHTAGITFNASAGPFIFEGPGSLVVDAGIVNNSAQTQIFDLQVSANLSQTFTAASDELIFNGGVEVPFGQNLTVGGGFATTIETLSGTGALTKNGAGNLMLDGSGSPIAADLILNSGSTYLGNTVTHMFAAASSVQVNSTARLFVGSDTQVHGGLALQASATLDILSGAVLKMKGGSNFTAAGSVRIGGNSTTAAGLSFEDGATGSFANGLHVASNLSSDGTLSVVGSGTTLAVAGGSSWGTSGDAFVSFNTGSAASFGNITIGNGSFGSAQVFVDSASVTSGNLFLNLTSTTSSNSLLVIGPGSTWEQAGASILRIYGADVRVDGGTFITGTGTGESQIGSGSNLEIGNQGTFHANSTVRLFAGGRLSVDAFSVFTLAPNTALHIQGGVASFAGNQPISGGTFLVTSSAARLENTDGDFFVSGDGVLSVSGGGDVVVSGGANVGSDGPGTMLTNGLGSSVNASGPSTWGTGPAGLASIGFSNSATGSFGGVAIGSAGGNGTATVMSSADVTSSQLEIASSAIANTIGSLTITGSGSTWGVSNAGAPVRIGAVASSQGTLNVQSGGTFTAGSGGITVENTGQINILGGALASTGPLTLNGANARLDITGGALAIAAGQRLTTAGGADANFSSLTMNGWDGVIEGNGSTWTVTAGNAVVGGVAASTLTLRTGGLFTAPIGTLTVANTGILNIQGGTLTLHHTPINNGVVNFVAGTVNYLAGGNLFIDADGFLGANVTLGLGKRLNVANSTSISAGQTLTLAGGYLSTNGLVNNGGRIDFLSGTLELTTFDGLIIGSGPLGSRVTLGEGSTLVVPSATTINAGATLRLEGGEFSSSVLTNYGTLDHHDGALTLSSTLANLASGRIFLSGSASPAGVINNSGRITLQDGLGYLGGAGNLSNSGVVTGDGTIARPVTNNTAGQIRAEAGKTLLLTGTFAPNAGTLSLEGGTLEFTNSITNASGGFISGRGSLRTGGLTNSGVMAFSGGNTDVHGDVTNAPGGRIVTSSAGAVTTFFDDVVNNGTEIFTGLDASTVFFGLQSGAGSFTGPGTVYLHGDLRPGNSPAAVSYEGDLVLGSSTELTLELGGLAPGLGYDTLAIGGTFFADGTLDVVLYDGFVPAMGNQFDLFDAGALAGDFDQVNLPALGGGLDWDASELRTNGEIVVVPEPGGVALLLAGIGALGFRRRRNHTR